MAAGGGLTLRVLLAGWRPGDRGSGLVTSGAAEPGTVPWEAVPRPQQRPPRLAAMGPSSLGRQLDIFKRFKKSKFYVKNSKCYTSATN